MNNKTDYKSEWDSGEHYIRWDKVFETLADALITYDIKGRVFSWNRTAMELYGYQFSEIIGKSIKVLSDSKNGSDILSLLRPDFSLRNFELNRVTKDQNRLTVSVSISPIIDEVGELIGFSEVSRDISNQKRLIEQMQEMILIDELTGLFNRRHLIDTISKEVHRTKRYNRPLSVIFLDIDKFKNYNDSFGHPEGDRVLAKFSEILRRSIRECDLPFRYGGEEFVILLPDTIMEQAVIVGERVKSNMAREKFKPETVMPARFISLTVSLGITSYRKGDTGSSLIDRSDRAMYQAKAEGGDRVSIL